MALADQIIREVELLQRLPRIQLNGFPANHAAAFSEALRYYLLEHTEDGVRLRVVVTFDADIIQEIKACGLVWPDTWISYGFTDKYGTKHRTQYNPLVRRAGAMVLEALKRFQGGR